MAYANRAVSWDQLDDHTYELMVALVLNYRHPNSKRTDGAGGDGGKDVHFLGPDGLEVERARRVGDDVLRFDDRGLHLSIRHAPSMAANSSPQRYSQDLAPRSLAKALGSEISPRLKERSAGTSKSPIAAKYRWCWGTKERMVTETRRRRGATQWQLAQAAQRLSSGAGSKFRP